MKRFIIAALAAALFAGTSAHAGPIRDRIAARFARPCQPCPAQAAAPTACAGPQAAPPAGYTVPTAPVQTVAFYQPQCQPGPVQAFAGQVIQATGQAVQTVGQAVQAYQMPAFAPRT